MSTRPGANVLGTHVLEYIFEVPVLVLVDIKGHVLDSCLVHRFYEYI